MCSVHKLELLSLGTLHSLMLLDKAQTERICDMSENPHHQDIIAVQKLGIGQISGAHPDAYNFSHTAVN